MDKRKKRIVDLFDKIAFSGILQLTGTANGFSPHSLNFGTNYKYLTELFTILDSLSSLICNFYEVQKRRSADFEAFKLCRVIVLIS